jgi:hypothetical protein
VAYLHKPFDVQVLLEARRRSPLSSTHLARARGAGNGQPIAAPRDVILNTLCPRVSRLVRHTLPVSKMMAMTLWTNVPFTIRPPQALLVSD